MVLIGGVETGSLKYPRQYQVVTGAMSMVLITLRTVPLDGSFPLRYQAMNHGGAVPDGLDVGQKIGTLAKSIRNILVRRENEICH